MLAPEADDAEGLSERGAGQSALAHGAEVVHDDAERDLLGVVAVALAEGEEAVESAGVGVERERRPTDSPEEVEPGQSGGGLSDERDVSHDRGMGMRREVIPSRIGVNPS